MIVTVTLNTAIDKAYQLDGPLCDGTVMRVSRCTDSAGGKGLNAARAVASCGEEALATGFVGGHNGHRLCQLLDEDGIAHDFVSVKEETRCCVNILEPGGRSTEFLEPGRSLTQADIAALKEKLHTIAAHSDIVTFNGSASKGVPADIYAQLIAIVRQAGKIALLDTSGELLLKSLAARPFMIKPNTDEIEAILGQKPHSLEEIISAAQKVHHDYGIEYVVVSLGAKGSVLVCKEGVYRGYAPKIDVLNPVGSGDTMVGAFAVAMRQQKSVPEQLSWAMSCASANCLSPSTGHFDIKLAVELSKNTQVEKLA